MIQPLPPALQSEQSSETPTQQTWRRAIGALGKDVVAVRNGVESPLRVNVVYHVDGKLAPIEFEGYALVDSARSRTLI
jgi:hypothetical protein